ncbi:MAG: nitroreductase family protein [Candidatus Dojkabacteria bacterium]|nr:nitroreductase family protein [Candidatus Dojkabacteria bacterium]
MLDIIKKRRSIREFEDKEVEDEKIREILNAAMVAPSAKNKKAWEFVVVKDKDMLKKLADSGPWASFVGISKVAIVIIGDEELSSKWVEDCSLAAGQIYLEATNQGLGTCWAHIREGKTVDGENAEEFVRRLLDIPQKKRVLCIMALGYPSYWPKYYGEKDFDEKKVFYEKYK